MDFGFTSVVHEVNRPITSPCSQWFTCFCSVEVEVEVEPISLPQRRGVLACQSTPPQAGANTP